MVCKSTNTNIYGQRMHLRWSCPVGRSCTVGGPRPIVGVVSGGVVGGGGTTPGHWWGQGPFAVVGPLVSPRHPPSPRKMALQAASSLSRRIKKAGLFGVNRNTWQWTWGLSESFLYIVGESSQRSICVCVYDVEKKLLLGSQVKICCTKSRSGAAWPCTAIAKY